MSSNSFVALEFYHWVATNQLQAELIFQHLDAEIVLLFAKLIPRYMLFLVDMLTWAKPDRFKAINPQTPAKFRIPLSIGLKVTPMVFYGMMENAFFHKFEGSVFKGQTEKDNGYDGLMKFLVNNLTLVGPRDDIKHYGENAVQTVCTRGSLELATATAEAFKLCPDSFSRKKARHIAYDLSESGKCDILRWFFERFNFSEQDITAFCYDALKHACVNGNMDIAQWACEKTKFNQELFRAENFICFRHACMHGHLELAKWFAETFKMISLSVRVSETLEHTVLYNGGYAVVEWLCDFCQITKTDVERCFAFLKRMVRDYTHVDVLHLLLKKADMEPADCRSFMSDNLFRLLTK